MNISRDQYLRETTDLKPIKGHYDHAWWYEDYIIGQKLIRYSGMKTLDREKFEMVHNDWCQKVEL